MPPPKLYPESLVTRHPTGTRAALQAIAKRQKCSEADLVRQALADWLERAGKQRGSKR